MTTIVLTEGEVQVLNAVLYQLQFFLPPERPEWDDLSVRTKHSPQESMALLQSVRSKLT